MARAHLLRCGTNAPAFLAGITLPALVDVARKCFNESTLRTKFAFKKFRRLLRPKGKS